MKRFTRFIVESPHETDTPVSVNTFLPQTPQLEWNVESIRQAVLNGDLVTQLTPVPVSRCVPTQKTVSMPKVMRYLHMNLADERPPVVLPHEGSFIIIDGHHRICAEAIDRQTSVDATCIDRESFDRFFPAPTTL